MQQLQKKYANNRAKLNEEIQALYERRGVSPMSGCLPQFIPLPIMMVCTMRYSSRCSISSA